MMQAFVSFAVPDFVLSPVNFVVYIYQLVLGDSLGNSSGTASSDGQSEAGCAAVAFIMYSVLICTYLAPVSVAFITFLKFNSVSKGISNFAISSALLLGGCVLLPLVLGLIL